MSPPCRCGRGPETAAHLILHCTELTSRRRTLHEALGRPLQTCIDLTDATREKEAAAIIVRWFLKLESLQEYRLAQRIAATADERTGGMQEGKGARAEPNLGEAKHQG